MFLEELNHEEKITFLELAHLVAHANGMVDEKEQLMMDRYDREMGIDIQVKDLKELSLESIISVFTTPKVKRIVFLEVIGVAFADGVYHEEQKLMINEIREAFGFSIEEYEEFKGWITKVNGLYAQAIEMVNA